MSLPEASEAINRVDAPGEAFTWLSNPLDWRPIDRFILLSWLVMLAPGLFISSLLSAMLWAPEYIAVNVAWPLLGLYVVHIVWLGGYIVTAVRRRQHRADWPGFENFIITSYTVTVIVSGYVTGTHFTETLLLLFLGVNITSALANIHKIRVLYFGVCAIMALFALNDFTATFAPAPLFKLVPLQHGAPLIGWLAVQVLIATILIALIYVCIAAISRWVERESLYREMSSIDGLTRLTNRRSFIERGESELARAQRAVHGTVTSIGCVMVDLDHFKQVNDTWGHHAGDAVLVAVSAIMVDSARQYDEVGRYGGEEFAILLPGVTTEGAVAVAERIRERIASTTVEVDGHQISMSASFGVACYPAPEVGGLNDLLKAADAALYEAKESGRNRVIVAKQAA